MSEKPPVIIDNGSGVIKIGFSGTVPPCPLVPTIIGRPRAATQAAAGGMNMNRNYVGQDAQRLRGVLNLKYPIADGIIKDWDAMQEIWEYCFSQLGIKPSEHKFLVTEPPRNPNANREKITEIFMEKYRARGVYVACTGTLALYSVGKTTGVVVDSGDAVTQAVPVYEGFNMPYAIKKNLIAGREVTNHIVELLAYEGIGQQGVESSWRQTIGLMLKEQMCFVSYNPKADYKKATKSDELAMTYFLPDGQALAINTPRFMGPEAIFMPSLIREGDETPGMHKLVHAAIQECDMDIRRELYMTIVLSGGNTLFPGLPERLQKEVFKLVNKKCLVMVEDPDDRYYSVWDGASVLTALPTFDNQWITRADYVDAGSRVVHRKCLI